ncbi:hypothetical protein Vretifemale_14512 [Volvox reticuliferus]|uniref:Uncharacterized protein n=1 Tax=Volvox reticuliferus TaxID=1737510 RepID=A0A8J4FVQ5_9CHLO|nr:hypothetical protein Vretifemale_14512 [Volvox reticuliferus]
MQGYYGYLPLCDLDVYAAPTVVCCVPNLRTQARDGIRGLPGLPVARPGCREQQVRDRYVLGLSVGASWSQIESVVLARRSGGWRRPLAVEKKNEEPGHNSPRQSSSCR